MIRTTTIKTPIGNATLAASYKGLKGLWIEGQSKFPKDVDRWLVDNNMEIFSQVKDWLDRYFAGENPEIDFPLDLEGTDFREDIWDMLVQIPYGELSTYGCIADAYAEKNQLESMSAQAVGGAIGSNPISIIVPCHRVVGSNHSLTGYASGVDNKVYLLELEQAEFKKDKFTDFK